MKTEILKLHDLYWFSYLDGDITTMADLLAEEYTQIGSAEREVFFNKNEAVQFLHETIDQVAGKLEMRNRKTSVELLNETFIVYELCDVYALADEKWLFYNKFRSTTLLQKKEQGWKFIHQHSSFSDSGTSEGQNVSIEKIAAENQQLRDAVKQRTMELEQQATVLEQANVALKKSLDEHEKTRERELAQAREIEKAHVELQQTHEHLKLTQAQLIQKEKLASLGQLTAGIAHEIKNPLNFINNFAEINGELAQELREVLNPDDDLNEIITDLKKNAELIAQHGKRADAIIRDMMKHASTGVGQPEKIEINKLISEYIDLAYHGKRAQTSDFQVEIKRELSENAGIVELRPGEIGRVILNLLTNAFDSVTEQVNKVNGDYLPTVKVVTNRIEDQVEILISDNGTGIPEAIREKIFEPFFTTKPTGKGTGLGLSLSYDIITQGHNGSLTLQSNEHEGTTFSITLPITHSTSIS